MMQPTDAMRATLPRIEVLRVKPIDPAVRRLRFQLSDGSVDLMKAFSLGGSEGVGGVWKIPPHIALPETFDTRYGQWRGHGQSERTLQWPAASLPRNPSITQR